jgi:hypothetical protein
MFRIIISSIKHTNHTCRFAQQGSLRRCADCPESHHGEVDTQTRFQHKTNKLTPQTSSLNKHERNKNMSTRLYQLLACMDVPPTCGVGNAVAVLRRRIKDEERARHLNPETRCPMITAVGTKRGVQLQSYACRPCSVFTQVARCACFLLSTRRARVFPPTPHECNEDATCYQTQGAGIRWAAGQRGRIHDTRAHTLHSGTANRQGHCSIWNKRTMWLEQRQPHASSNRSTHTPERNNRLT